MQQKCVVGNDRKEKQNTPNSSIGIHQATYLKRSKAEQVFDVFFIMLKRYLDFQLSMAADLFLFYFSAFNLVFLLFHCYCSHRFTSIRK
jgi:hypothetical protein